MKNFVGWLFIVICIGYLIFLIRRWREVNRPHLTEQQCEEYSWLVVDDLFASSSRPLKSVRILPSYWQCLGLNVTQWIFLCRWMDARGIAMTPGGMFGNWGWNEIVMNSPPPVLVGSVIGCKQFSCSGDAVWRLIMGCRRMLGVEDRAAIMAGVNVGLSKTRIAHLIGRSPSVVCREIARHTGPDGQYRAEEADKAARAARRRPKKRLLDCDEVLRDRVIADLSQGHTPRQISGRLRAEACGTLPTMDTSPDAQGHTISHEAIYTWIYAHPKKTLIEHGICLPSRRWMRKKPPASGRKPPIVGMRLIDERPDIADRKIPGNWEGDLIIGQDGASACATLVERTTRYLIIVALPLGRKADQVCDALTRRIQGLPDQAMRTLTWDQGREMARHQRLTHDTGVEVFFAHPHSPWERGTNENTNRLIRRYLPKGTPITSHQPYLDAIAYELNNCPRATLDYRTPTEAFNELIATTH